MDSLTAIVCAILSNQVLLAPHCHIEPGPLAIDGSRTATVNVDFPAVITQAVSIRGMIRQAQDPNLVRKKDQL